MTFEAALTRHYRSRKEAYGYLASRGFLLLPSGWENGRWAARIDMANGDFIVNIWLRRDDAA